MDQLNFIEIIILIIVFIFSFKILKSFLKAIILLAVLILILYFLQTNNIINLKSYGVFYQNILNFRN
ncbi:MAG: hypothetical protein GX752_00865 [Clostridium sp.]|nr:hypothetical protein [Clostridium sp.]